MYSDRNDWLEPVGFPHSEISGSLAVCASPKLIAAYHVLHRLHAPRHPPCALSSLTIKFAHRKLRSAHRSLTPSSSRVPKSSLDDSLYPEEYCFLSDTLIVFGRPTVPRGIFFGNFAYSIIKEHSTASVPE